MIQKALTIHINFSYHLRRFGDYGPATRQWLSSSETQYLQHQYRMKISDRMVSSPQPSPDHVVPSPRTYMSSSPLLSHNAQHMRSAPPPPIPMTHSAHCAYVDRETQLTPSSQLPSGHRTQLPGRRPPPPPVSMGIGPHAATLSPILPAYGVECAYATAADVPIHGPTSPSQLPSDLFPTQYCALSPPRLQRRPESLMSRPFET